MKTHDLIAFLSDDLAPVRTGRVTGLLLLGLVGGMAGSMLLMLAFLGLRPDLRSAVMGGPFWMKFAYVLALAALGLWIVERQARAGAGARRPFRLLAAPIVALTLVAAWQLSAPRVDNETLLMGRSADVCPFAILILSLPILAGLAMTLRHLAPTRLRLAGAGAGLAAGAAGATVYCLHCPEVGAPFILIWYSLGIALSAGLGAIMGRRLLRW